MIKNAIFKAVLALAALCAFSSCGERIGQPAYRVCAFVWPSCHDDSLAREYLWKEGIGEWEVIKRGDPRFEGHYQPKQPLWGYEMDDDPLVVEKWINEALSHGVNTFVYDWYWFKNYPYLEGALDDGFLKAPSCDKMGFYLMWANHDVKYNYWNYHLHGDNDSLLFTGEVSPEQYETIVHRVIDKYFQLSNYVKIDGCPVFMIFSIENFLETFDYDLDRAAQAVQYFREECVKAGFKGLHLQTTLRGNGVDKDFYLKEFDVWRSRLGIDSFVTYNMIGTDKDYLTYGRKGTEYWYRWSDYLNVPFFPTVSIGWDDTPRFPAKGEDDVVLYHRTPEAFQHFLEGAKDYADKHGDQPAFVYINAWNEWIEDAYLLPDVCYGYGYLDAVKNVFGPCKRRPE